MCIAHPLIKRRDSNTIIGFHKKGEAGGFNLHGSCTGDVDQKTNCISRRGSCHRIHRLRGWSINGSTDKRLDTGWVRGTRTLVLANGRIAGGIGNLDVQTITKEDRIIDHQAAGQQIKKKKDSS